MMSRNGIDPIAVMKQIDGMSMQQLLQQSAATAKVLKSDPRNFPAHFALAIMYRNSDENLKALSHFKKAHKLEPNVEIVLELICKLLIKDLGKHQQALKYLQKWLLLRKGSNDSALIWIWIAECQTELGKTDVALKALDRAKRLSPDEQRVYLAFSKVYGAIGDVESATEYAKRSFEIEPNEEAMTVLSRLPNFGDDQNILESVIKLAEETEKPNVAANLYGAIAKGYERLGNYQNAFQFIEKSNEFPREKLDREKELVKFRNLKATFTKNFINDLNGLGHNSNQLIFVLGMPRSGTTLRV